MQRRKYPTTVFFLFLRWREAENDVEREREREREREGARFRESAFRSCIFFVFCSVYEAIATTTTTTTTLLKFR
jgi:hypothetical protein